MRRVLMLMVLLSIASPAGAVSLLPGDILVLGTSTDVGQGIIHVDPVTHAQTLVAPGAFADFAVTSDGSLFAIAGDSVVRVDPGTGVQTPVATGGLLGSLADAGVEDRPSIAAGDGALFVASTHDDRVVRIDANTGAQAVFATGFLHGLPSARGIAALSLGVNGDLLVLNRFSLSSEVVSVDLVFGTQTQLFCCGDLITDPVGLGVSPGGVLFGADYSQGQSIYRLDSLGEVKVLGPVFPDADGNSAVGNALNVVVDASGALLGTRSIPSGGPVTQPPGDLVRLDLGTGVLEYLALGIFPEVEIMPVPEPGTALLLSFGLAALALRSRSR